MENNKYSREDAYQSLEMVNSWINNVDNKISYALAFIGVLIGFVFIQDTPKTIENISQADEFNCYDTGCGASENERDRVSQEADAPVSASGGGYQFVER